MRDYKYDEENINLRDSLKGMVKGQNRWGLFIDLKIENDETEVYNKVISVFGYWGGQVPKGTEVTCSIKCWPKENKDILVTIDSVEYSEDLEMIA